jgi:hypothetical protein
MEEVDLVLRLMLESEDARWIAEQIEASFAQGISMSVKKAIVDGRFFELEPPTGLSKIEQRKREKYETTRPYTDSDKKELIVTALRAVFIDLPAIQSAGIKGLREIGADFTRVEFMPPAELEQGHSGYSRSLAEAETQESSLRVRVERFLAEFNK